MTNWLLRWVVSGVALYIVSLLPIGVEIKSFTGVLAATVVIGLLNSLVRPVLALLTLPLNCMTFGLFSFVLNALLFASTHLFVPDFRVTNVLGALLGPILMGLISGVLNFFLPDKKDKR